MLAQEAGTGWRAPAELWETTGAAVCQERLKLSRENECLPFWPR